MHIGRKRDHGTINGIKNGYFIAIRPMAMRRIAMCEQAGTGMRMMREEWQKLGHPAPTYKNDRSWKAFDLFIPELDREVDPRT